MRSKCWVSFKLVASLVVWLEGAPGLGNPSYGTSSFGGSNPNHHTAWANSDAQRPEGHPFCSVELKGGPFPKKGGKGHDWATKLRAA